MARPIRMLSGADSNAVDGTVVWSPVRSLWFSLMAVAALIGCCLTASWSAFLMAAILTAFTLCSGHSVGLHRLLIHRSFACPWWLEHGLVFIGVLVGMGGPRRMMLMHEIRDWAQNQPQCHSFFSHQNHWLRDAWWNLHCECRLQNGPEFVPEAALTDSRFYRLLDRYWMAAQLPLAVVLYVFGGWSWVLWGICGRITVSVTGHWLVGHLAHNCGRQTWQVHGASIQGYNVPGLGLLTMGEAWHNNHHAFPDSACLGIQRGQLDPGWWLIAGLQRLGLAWETVLPEQVEVRKKLVQVDRRVPLFSFGKSPDRSAAEKGTSNVTAEHRVVAGTD